MKSKILVWAVFLFVVVGVVAVFDSAFLSPDVHPFLPRLPHQEQTFVDVLSRGSREYDAADNDFARGAARVHREQALCALGMPNQVDKWVGSVEKLSSNSSGFGVLTIRISEHATVSTTNNEFSDGIGSLSTLIGPNDPVYAQLSHLGEGGTVVFSGILESSDTDCFAEDSVTQSGSMADPQFYMHFSSVRPLTEPQ